MFDYALPALIGGGMIGLASALLLVLTGKTAGISGIVGGVVAREKNESGWKLAFILGLVAGGVLLGFLIPDNIADAALHPLPLTAVSGLIVGVGTRMGGG